MAYLSINPNTFIARIAREYDVLPSKLQIRCTGGCFKSSRSAAGKALTDEMEEAICEYIHQLDSFDMLARPIMIRKAANYLLAEAEIDRGRGSLDQTIPYETSRIRQKKAEITCCCSKRMRII